MPPVRRKPKKKKSGYTEWHLHELRTGYEYHVFPAFQGDDEARRAAWEIFRDEILQDWIREEPRQSSPHIGPGPGTRPWAWWQYDAKELLLRLNGIHPFENPERIAHVERQAKKYPAFKKHAYKLFYGTPSCSCVPDDFEASYETQAAYIDRLDLWLPGEKEAWQQRGGQSS